MCTVTVGTAGDYPTIGAALNHPRVTHISLLSGFVMVEQVTVYQRDLSHITITAEDSEVPIVRSTLQEVTLGDTKPGSHPAFAAVRTASLPMIDCVFNMDSSGTADGRHGVYVGEASRAVIARDAGIKNVGDRGLYVYNGVVFARDTVWSGAKVGVRVSNASVVNIRDSSLNDCDQYGLWAAGASLVNAHGVNCANAGDRAINVVASRVDADEAICTNAGGRAVNAAKVSMINLAEADCDNAGGNEAVAAWTGSIINAVGATMLSAGNPVKTGTGGVVYQ